MPEINDHLNTHVFDSSSFVGGITYSRPQSMAEAIQNTPRAPPQHAQPTRLSQAEVDRLMASAGFRRRPPQEQSLDFDPNNLTISERVGLNDMGIHRPRLYKRTGDKS